MTATVSCQEKRRPERSSSSSVLPPTNSIAKKGRSSCSPESQQLGDAWVPEAHQGVDLGLKPPPAASGCRRGAAAAS